MIAARLAAKTFSSVSRLDICPNGDVISHNKRAIFALKSANGGARHRSFEEIKKGPFAVEKKHLPRANIDSGLSNGEFPLFEMNFAVNHSHAINYI